MRRATRDSNGLVHVTLMMCNACPEDATFVLPEPRLEWTKLFDSSEPLAPEGPVEASAQCVPAHALVLLLAATEPWPKETQQ